MKLNMRICLLYCLHFSYVLSIAPAGTDTVICNYKQIPNVYKECKKCEAAFDTTYFQRSDPNMFDDEDFRLYRGGTLDQDWLDGR